jgi:hypothetical protein
MPSRRRGRFAAPAILALALAGCGGGETGQTTAPDGVDLTEITAAGLDRAIAEQKGKVVLVDVWALS